MKITKYFESRFINFALQRKKSNFIKENARCPLLTVDVLGKLKWIGKEDC